MENNIDQTLEPDLGLQNAAQQMNDNAHEQPKDMVNHLPDQAQKNIVQDTVQLLSHS